LNTNSIWAEINLFLPKYLIKNSFMDKKTILLLGIDGDFTIQYVMDWLYSYNTPQKLDSKYKQKTNKFAV